MGVVGDFADFQNGFAFKSKDFCEDGEYNVIKIKELKDGKIKFTSDTARVKHADGIEKYVVNDGDILFALTGDPVSKPNPLSWVGRVSRYKGDSNAVLNQRVCKVIPKEGLNPLYLYYFFRNDLEFYQLAGKATGSASQANISTKTISDTYINLPEIEYQNKVVDILSSIDKKIEINEKINDNLYKQLSLSFKHDYLEVCAEHPEWITTTLDDLTDKFATGLNPRKNFVLGHGTNYYVTIKNMLNNRIYLNNKCDKVDDEALIKINNRSDLKPGDLLFSGIGTIGRTYLINKPATNWNISESVFTIRPSSAISSEFLFLLLLSNEMQDYAISNSSGSVQKGIRMADLKKYSVICPSPSYMESLTSMWRPMISLIKQNEDESDSLAILRDTLLPKLMSGELDVTDINL